MRVAIGLSLAGILALAAGFGRFAAMIGSVETPPVRHADGIVALTGGADRVPEAINLLLEGHAERLLITGVNPTTTREDLARHVPNASALVECCVDLGYLAANTVGNARETADWARMHDIHTLIVVTSNYHMPRAMAEIAYRLPDVELQAYPVISERAKVEAWWANAQRTRLVLGEYLKFLAVKARQAVVPVFDDSGQHLAKRSI